MNTAIYISIAATLFGAASLIATFFKSKSAQERLSLIEINSDQADALEKKFYKQQLLIEETNEIVAQQARLIAALESKVFGISNNHETKSETVRSCPPLKVEMAENCRRILKLAKRGHDAETIASTLGMLPGEVELIVNLNGEKAKAANQA